MPDYPSPRLTGIHVRQSCPAAGCTPGTPCAECQAALTEATAAAAQTLAARHGHQAGEPCPRCAAILAPRPPAAADHTCSCEWMFHGVTRQENGDGTTVTLTLDGWRYTTNAERDPGDTAACRWCLEPIRRTARRTWRSAVGEDCAASGPAGFHQPDPLPQTARAAAPCAAVTVPLRTETRAGKTWIIYEAGAAYDLARAHCGDWYTVVWQGRGWTVELATGVPVWRTTS